MATKDLSSRCKLRKFFKKNLSKQGILESKYEKNWKSKNDLKSRLRALNKELWAIYVFLPTWNLTIAKNTNVKQQKSKHHEKLNFNRQKIQEF